MAVRHILALKHFTCVSCCSEWAFAGSRSSQVPQLFFSSFTSEQGHFLLEEENTGNGKCKKLLGGQGRRNGLAISSSLF